MTPIVDGKREARSFLEFIVKANMKDAKDGAGGKHAAPAKGAEGSSAAKAAAPLDRAREAAGGAQPPSRGEGASSVSQSTAESVLAASALQPTAAGCPQTAPPQLDEVAGLEGTLPPMRKRAKHESDPPPRLLAAAPPCQAPTAPLLTGAPAVLPLAAAPPAISPRAPNWSHAAEITQMKEKMKERIKESGGYGATVDDADRQRSAQAAWTLSETAAINMSHPRNHELLTFIRTTRERIDGTEDPHRTLPSSPGSPRLSLPAATVSSPTTAASLPFAASLARSPGHPPRVPKVQESAAALDTDAFGIPILSRLSAEETDDVAFAEKRFLLESEDHASQAAEEGDLDLQSAMIGSGMLLRNASVFLDINDDFLLQDDDHVFLYDADEVRSLRKDPALKDA